MKNYYHSFLYFLFMMGSLVSCVSDEDLYVKKGSVPYEEYVTAQLKLTGDILYITESPLTKASLSDDLTAIQVYEMNINTQGYTIQNAYAYGLYENRDLPNITVKLKKGSIYKFESSTVISGKSKLKLFNDGYSSPFIIDQSNNSTGCKVSNNMTYSYADYFRELNDSWSYLISDSRYSIPNVERFYCMQTYTATNETGLINLDMKRVSFGLKIVANGLESGKSLKIEARNMPSMIITGGLNDNKVEDIFTLPNQLNSYISGDRQETIRLSFTLIDGLNETSIAARDIPITRNKRTIITINIPANGEIPDVDNNELKITFEETEIIDGDNVTINP